MSDQRLYGYLLEFKDADHLLDGARMTMSFGYRRVEAYTPFPVPELQGILPRSSNPIPLLIFLGGLAGALLGYGIQYYSAVIDYPILVGGKPMHAWPAFIPVTFELAILFAALTGFLATIWINKLPQLHHPIFAASDFDLASRDRFFLLIEAEDEKFDPERTQRDLDQIPEAKSCPVNLK